MADNPEYHRLKTPEIQAIELQSFNFYQSFGRIMKIPPQLYEQLKKAGCSMKYIEADPRLEN